MKNSPLLIGMLMITSFTALGWGSETKKEKAVPMEPVVITATRLETPISRVANSITVITEEEIRQQNARSILDVLRNVPSLDVVRTGSLGGTTSVFLRGANSNHTLVQIDGVQINSPTTGIGEFANLTVDNIERIEILRGPQSTLYGSDAIGGVINIITKKGKGKPGLTFFGQGGSYDSQDFGSSFNWGSHQFNLSSSLTQGQTEGIRRFNSGYKNTTFSTRLGLEATPDLSLQLITRYIDGRLDLPSSRISPDPNSDQERDEWVITNILEHTLTDWWDYQLQLSLVDDDLEFNDPPDPGNLRDRLIFSRIDTQIWTADLHTNFYLGENYTFTFGGEWEKQKGDNTGLDFSGKRGNFFDEQIITRSFYSQIQLNLWDSLFPTLGYRVDDNSQFGSDNNFKVALAYLLGKTGSKLKGSWGGGFRAPTINQLSFPGFGNPNLQPEESEGFDIGFEQDLFNKCLHLGVTYFYNEFDQLIINIPTRDPAFPFGLKPSNISSARTKGIEVEASLKLDFGLNLTASYTHMNTEDDKGKKLPRRPDDKYGFNINYKFNNRLNLNFALTVVGNRKDLGDRTNAGYTKFDFAFAYNLIQNFRQFKNLELYLQGDNIFDEEYEEALDFPSPGSLYFLGIRANF